MTNVSQEIESVTDLEDIIKGCQKNDRRAQQALYVRFAPVMLGVAARYSSNRAEAEDILQDAFLKVFTKFNSYKNEGGSLEGWIRKVVVRTAIDFYRLKTRQQQLAREEIREEPDPHNSDIIDQISNSELLQIINELPEGYRIVLNLYAIEGYNHREIADMLDISEGTSKSQFSRAKKYLANLLEKKKFYNAIAV